MISITRVIFSALLLPAFAGSALALNESADKRIIEQILQEIELAPSMYARNETPVKPMALPQFAAAKLARYVVADVESVELHRKRWIANKVAYGKAYPMRAPLFEAEQEAKTLRALKIPLTLAAAGAPLPTPQQKAAVLQLQASLAVAIFKLDQVHKGMEDAAEWRNKQKIARWKADFDFAQVRVQTNLIYLLEIDFTFGQIRADGLPKLAKDQSGWVIVARPKISVPEGKAKALVKDRLNRLKKIQEEHADSPWSYFAERESKRDLGMEWVAKKK
jgi:hypothetical protein